MRATSPDCAPAGRSHCPCAVCFSVGGANPDPGPVGDGSRVRPVVVALRTDSSPDGSVTDAADGRLRGDGLGDAGALADVQPARSAGHPEPAAGRGGVAGGGPARSFGDVAVPGPAGDAVAVRPADNRRRSVGFALAFGFAVAVAFGQSVVVAVWRVFRAGVPRRRSVPRVRADRRGPADAGRVHRTTPRVTRYAGRLT